MTHYWKIRPRISEEVETLLETLPSTELAEIDEEAPTIPRIAVANYLADLEKDMANDT